MEERGLIIFPILFTSGESDPPPTTNHQPGFPPYHSRFFICDMCYHRPPNSANSDKLSDDAPGGPNTTDAVGKALFISKILSSCSRFALWTVLFSLFAGCPFISRPLVFLISATTDLTCTFPSLS